MSFRSARISTHLLVPNVANPRHELVANAENAVASLMQRMPRKIYALALDIAAHGLDPSSLPIVVPENGNYIVLEGNRRVAALRLMQNPDLAPMEAALRENFRALKALSAVPDDVECIIFDERDEADHWIELRHTGENDGAGVVRWGATEQQRFKRQRGSQTDAAMRFAEAMRTLFPDEIDFLASVDIVEAEVSTTLGRVIQNPERRSLLGFEQRGGTLFLKNDPEETFPLLERLFLDLSTGEETVTQLRDRRSMDDYISRLTREVPHEAVRLPELVSVDDWVRAETHKHDVLSKVSRGESDQPPSSADPVRGVEAAARLINPAVSTNEGAPNVPDASTSRRKRLRQERHVFQGISISHLDLRTSEVLKEAQKLYVDISPNLCAILIRVVLDLAASSLYRHLDRRPEDNVDFKVKLRSIADVVDPRVDDQLLVRARTLIESDGALSVKTMNGYVHGWNHSPLATDIRALSRAYGPLLVAIDRHARDNPRSQKPTRTH